MWGKRPFFTVLVLLGGSLAGSAGADFTLEDDGYRLTVMDRDRPVLAYQYRGEPLETGEEDPETGPAHFIHPLYGLWGEQVTGETPSLWAGLPGIHWGWAYCLADGELLDVWNREGGYREFERWRDTYADATTAELDLQNVWIQSATGEAKVLENVLIKVHLADGELRPIDLLLEFKNVSNGPLYLRGSGAQSGLAVRLNLDRDDWTFSGGAGRVKVGSAPVLSPWFDCSYRDDRRSTYSGLTILQHSDNPGFSSPNWTVTPEGVVTAGVDGEQRFELKPGQTLSFQYRLLLHRGFGPSMNLMREYVKWMKPPQATEEEPRRLK